MIYIVKLEYFSVILYYGHHTWYAHYHLYY